MTSMMNFLLILSIFHRDTTIEDLERCHPQMAIVFNNVSGQNKPDAVEKIEAYKELLTKESIRFYCQKVSDKTIIGKTQWLELKNIVMESTEYLEEEWYKNLSQYEKRMLESLIQAQNDVDEEQEKLALKLALSSDISEEQKKAFKPDRALIPIYDPIYSKEI